MKKIVVAGGGLVGSLIALMMKRRGHSVLILEKRPDIRKISQAAGRSINLVVTSRGLNALNQVGLLKSVLDITVPVTGRMIHSKTGETNYQAYGRDPSECNYSVSRGDLNRFLLNACEKNGIEIIFDSAVTSADLKQKKVKAGSKEMDYDILLGTDGAGSVIRTAMSEAIGPLYQNSTEILPSDYKELFLPLGPNGQPVFEKNVLHIWPRQTHMLMALPNLDGSFTMTLYAPNRGSEVSFEKLRSKDEIHRFLQTEFPDALEKMPGAVEDFIRNPQGTLGTVRSAPWVYQDSVALLGDAAHAIVPFFGQGMNLGFEDCVYFEQFLNAHPDHWEKSFSAFDRFQRPNANAIADMALENFVEMRDKVADPFFVLKKKIEARIEKEMPQDYRSRYGMITYTLIPYSLAKQAGEIQDAIFTEVCRGKSSEESVDFALAQKLVQEKFIPFVRKHKLSLEKYKV